MTKNQKEAGKVIYPLTVRLDIEFEADEAPPREVIQRQLEQILHDWLDSLGVVTTSAEWHQQCRPFRDYWAGDGDMN